MKISEKVAYLKGLEDGLNLDATKPETRMFNAIIGVLEELADEMDVQRADLVEMTERVDEIDIDLGDMEAFLFEGLAVEEFTEEDLEEGLPEEAFTVVYTTDDDVDEILAEEAVEATVFEAEDEAIEEALDAAEDDAAIFAAAEEVVAAAEEEELQEEVELPSQAAAAAAIAAEEVVETVAEDDDVYEVECPTCGEVIYVDQTILAQGGIICPKCQEKLEFEVEFED